MKLPLVLCLLVFASFVWPGKPHRPFPEIHYTTLAGETFSNENFLGKETVVILFHLGCPAAMDALRDIEEARQAGIPLPAIVGIAENTVDQLRMFNEPNSLPWSMIRTAFRLSPVSIPLIAECAQSVVYTDAEGNTHAGSQCRALGKKLHTDSSPTFVYVNQEGRITRIKKGYIAGGSLDARIRYLTGK